MKYDHIIVIYILVFQKKKKITNNNNNNNIYNAPGNCCFSWTDMLLK